MECWCKKFRWCVDVWIFFSLESVHPRRHVDLKKVWWEGNERGGRFTCFNIENGVSLKLVRKRMIIFETKYVFYLHTRINAHVLSLVWCLLRLDCTRKLIRLFISQILTERWGAQHRNTATPRPPPASIVHFFVINARCKKMLDFLFLLLCKNHAKVLISVDLFECNVFFFFLWESEYFKQQKNIHYHGPSHIFGREEKPTSYKPSPSDFIRR